MGGARIKGLIAKHRGSLARISVTMAAGVVSRLAQLGAVVVVARQLSPADFGLFVFATGASLVAALIGNLGWQFSFNRFFAIARREEGLAALRGLMLASNRAVLAGSVFAALALLVASLFHAKLGTGLVIAALLTIPYGLTLLRRQQLAGTGQAPFALMLDQGLASTVLLIAVLLFRLTVIEMLAVYGLAIAAGNIAATLLVRRRLPEGLSDAEPRFETKEWMRVSLTLLQGRFARLLLTRLDVVLLPALAGLAAAGIYGAALRVTYVLTFPQFVLQTISGPQFAEAFAEKRFDRVMRILALSVAFALVTALPFLVLFLAAPQWTMTFLYGEDYAGGALALVLVAIGQFAMGLAMPFDAILTMAGRERHVAVLNWFVLAISLALSFWLIPAYGATGAGIVTMVAGVVLLFGEAGLCREPLRTGSTSSGGQA
jgi:O-antigen/teichoic acid export membrane protein